MAESGGAILLAAGFSRRFGSDKRRHRLAEGAPLLLESLALYEAAFPRLTVVLRPEDDDLAQQVAAAARLPTTRIERCADAHLGMGHSLACGARAAGNWRYLFVALGDMAWVQPSTLVHLRDTLANAPTDAIVQPVYHGIPGHPVGFGRSHLPRLARLTGDTGARPLVAAAGPRLLRIAVTDPGVLEDLDHPPAEGIPDSP